MWNGEKLVKKQYKAGKELEVRQKSDTIKKKKERDYFYTGMYTFSF